MKCLACWEEIEDGEKVCYHCGSNQEEVKDFLTLALLSQQKKKITVEENSPILEYVFKVDPSVQEDVTISPTAKVEPLITSDRSREQTYTPSQPTWLATPQVSEPKTQTTKVAESVTKEKIIKCPGCEREVPVRKFCKYCGTQLQKACSKCEKLNSINAKFCTSCGENLEA